MREVRISLALVRRYFTDKVARLLESDDEKTRVPRVIVRVASVNFAFSRMYVSILFEPIIRTLLFVFVPILSRYIFFIVSSVTSVAEIEFFGILLKSSESIVNLVYSVINFPLEIAISLSPPLNFTG